MKNKNIQHRFSRLSYWLLSILICTLFSFSLVPFVYADAGDNSSGFAMRVGEDTVTKGNWEGNYGSDTAILCGYQYDVESNPQDLNTSTRFALDSSSNDLVIQDSNSPITSYTNGTSRLWCWTASQTDDSVLCMPQNISRDSFFAYAKDGYSTSFSFTVADTDVHAFSVYGTQHNSPRGNINVTIKDQSGVTLLTEVLPSNTFAGGKYLTYLVSGSFTFSLSEAGYDEGRQQGGFGINAVFFDPVVPNQISNISAQASVVDTSAILTWQEGTDLASNAKIIIDRKSANGNWCPIAMLDTGVLRYQDRSIVAGETYEYRIRTKLGLSYSDLSSSVTISIPSSSEDDLIISSGAIRAGEDTVTKGAWEGKYGSDCAILCGYQYDVVTNPPTLNASNKNRFALNPSYDLVIQDPSGYVSSYTLNGTLNRWCFLADQSDDSVLDMPSGSTLNKFNAYAKAAVPADYTFTLTDDSVHAVSIYGSQNAFSFVDDVVISIKNSSTGEVYLTEVLPKSVFENGEYLTYLVSGSFTISLSSDTEVGGAGITGVFFDPVITNETTSLSVSPGSLARSALLTWNENDTMPGDTKIIIERRMDNETTWERLAVVNAGVRSYLDTNLSTGTTYEYQIRTVLATSYSLPKKPVQYLCPPYTATELQFDMQTYQIDNTSQLLDVQITLEQVENSNPCAGQSITLSVDYGHHIQTVGSQLTDTSGIALFSFNPDYLGNAVLKASFSDNDVDQLQNSCTQAELYVGETAWTAAPVVYSISDGVLPDDLISINGYGIKADDMSDVKVYYSAHSTATSPATPPTGALEMNKVQEDARDGFFIVTQLPANATPGVYDIWVENEFGVSAPIVLNIARPLFISEYEAWNGQTIVISGRNFQSAQFGSSTQTKVRLRNAVNSYEQEISKLTPYSISFIVNTATLGEYQVEVSNDNGLTWTSLSSGQTLTVVDVGEDPLGLGLAWMDHFNWDDYFTVTDTVYGADGTDSSDDTLAVQAAINDAYSNGGGVVYFPAGTYYISGLDIPSNIVLLGESRDSTTITYWEATPGSILFESTGDGRTIGHQGFARFSVVVADQAKVPEAFFWLGREWENGGSNASLRSGVEFFLKEVNVTCSQTEAASTGRGVVIIADERFVGQDCVFSGYSASWDKIRVNKYTYYSNLSTTFQSGTLTSIADYAFFEKCYVKGGFLSDDPVDNHGIFPKQNSHVENCVVEQVGGIDSDGETYCYEAASGALEYGDIINATNNSVTVITGDGTLDLNGQPINYGHPAVYITDGRGTGQYRYVESYDSDLGTITVTRNWDVVPDATSKMTLLCLVDNATLYNNISRDSGKGIYLYGSLADQVTAYNTLVNTEGILVQCAHAKFNRNNSVFKVSVRENVIYGTSNQTDDTKIAVTSARRINGNDYYAVACYNIEIRDNQITGVRGSVSQGNTEAPAYSGIVSEPAKYGDNWVADGYFGDHTNILIENNYMKDLDTAITTTEGNWGVVLKGNQVENVGVIRNDIYEYGGTKLETVCNASEVTAMRAILSNYIAVWSFVNSSDFTEDSYSKLNSAITAANALLSQTESSVDDLCKALQEIRICAGQLVKAAMDAVAAEEPGESENPDKPGHGAKPAPEPETGMRFIDVSRGDWFYDSVKYVYDNGLMNGTGSNTFSPNSQTTRGMIVTILYRQSGSPSVSSDKATWWSDARVWAMENGISDGTNMDGKITREQLAAMLYRYAKLTGADVSARGDLDKFADNAQISDWAVEAMQWAVGEGILGGRPDGTLDPKGLATRAEVAAMLMRFCENK